MRPWLVLVAACGAPPAAGPDGATPVDAAPIADAYTIDAPPPPAVAITVTVDSTRFVTREHMLAAVEMQISGEPLAEAMGRDLTGYSRDLIPPDIYFDATQGGFWIDLAGFSTAVESYEYSKQPMNGLAFEYAAGTALAHAPLVANNLVPMLQHFAAASNATGKWVFAPNTFPTHNPFGDVNPNGAGVPADNPLGWPGMWPTAHVFRSFDPAMDPTDTADLSCTIASDDNPSEMGETLISADYECSAKTLHLRDRAAQVDATITPGADGFSGWKYALWVMNYLQVMHDANNAAVTAVAAPELASVGVPGNQITGLDPGAVAGTYLGSSDIEGFQAQMFILSLDARADDWLHHLTTTDGTTLSGFAAVADALAYDEAQPLRWFPGAIAVTETADPSGFPVPHYALASADPELLDLIGLATGYATLYALTDTSNADVGGAQTALAYFDGDPFAADNQLADGEDTVHDRALAMIRVALVDVDRMFVDPASQLLVDTRGGHTLSATTAAYTIVGLRAVRRALGSQLELYSNNLPDRAIATTPLDALPLHAPGDPTVTFTGRVDQLLRRHADLLLDELTDATGRAYTGWDVAAHAPIAADDIIDAHAAAIRGLFAAYLATGDTRYRDRAIAVFARMDARFYDADARIYAVTQPPVDAVTYTPLRFALVQSALRDIYELVASRPGHEDLEPVIEGRLARLNKLVLNGWDDRDRDKSVDWPDECANVIDGLPRGGLQMAERTLTGEIGRLKDQGAGGGPPTSDREHDCVPEIDDAHLPAALADSVTFHIARGSP
jgi:hypothetical protein